MGKNNPTVYLNRARSNGLKRIADSRKTFTEHTDAKGNVYVSTDQPTIIDLIREAIDYYLKEFERQQLPPERKYMHKPLIAKHVINKAAVSPEEWAMWQGIKRGEYDQGPAVTSEDQAAEGEGEG